MVMQRSRKSQSPREAAWEFDPPALLNGSVAEWRGIRLQPGMDVGSTPTRASRRAARMVSDRPAKARSSGRTCRFDPCALRSCSVAAAPVAQSEEAPASKAGTCWFESSRAHCARASTPTGRGDGLRGRSVRVRIPPRPRGTVAPTVERETENLRVGGSSPPRSTGCPRSPIWKRRDAQDVVVGGSNPLAGTTGRWPSGEGKAL